MFLIFLHLVWAQFYGLASGNESVTLEDCYKAAIERSATVSEKEQLLIQSQELESQAFGSLLPNLSGSAAYFIQQSPSDPLTQSFFPSTQPTVKLTLTQPIFRGFREFATLRQLSHQSEVQKQEKQSALVQLHVDVSRNYFSLLSLQEEISVLKTQLDLYDDRIQDLKKRTRTGQSSTSDTLTAQAAKAATLAQLKQTEGQYRSNREVFLYLTGFTTETRLNKPAFSLNQNIPLSEYLHALETRPDIVAGKQRLDAAEEAVTVARGGHLPTADLLGNYYLLRPQGVFSEIKWDVQATLTIPFYSGGAVKAKVNEANSQKAQAEAALLGVRRLAEQEIRSLYESHQSSIEEIKALEQSMKMAEENYRVLKVDYSRGLTRNLDVLQALSQYQEGKRALNRARWNAQANLVRLQFISHLSPTEIGRK